MFVHLPSGEFYIVILSFVCMRMGEFVMVLKNKVVLQQFMSMLYRGVAVGVVHAPFSVQLLSVRKAVRSRARTAKPIVACSSLLLLFPAEDKIESSLLFNLLGDGMVRTGHAKSPSATFGVLNNIFSSCFIPRLSQSV